MSVRRHPSQAELGKIAANDREAFGELTGGIAHDLNNLLTVIMSAAEALAEDLVHGSDQQDLALTSLQAAEASAKLVRRLLAASRPQAPKFETIDCRAAVDAIRPFAHRLVRDDISLKIQAPAHPLFCAADPVGLESALLNLLINARDATPAGGSLSLRAEAVSLRGRGAARLSLTPGAYVVFTVRDTGAGMSPETMRRALEPFFTTKGPGGTGLGLSTVEGFARQSGGRLTIASELGRGATISVYLPRMTPLRPRLQSVANASSND